MNMLRAMALLSFAIPLANMASAQDGDLLGNLTRPRAGESRRASSANPDLAKNGDAWTIPPGESVTIADIEGPGAIEHIWCTVGSRDPFHGRSLVLRIYWDGSDKPSVEAPLGDFFGVGHGAGASFQSIPVAVSSHGRSRNCFWKMPFHKRAVLKVSNDATAYGGATFYFHVDWRRLPSLPEECLYFHAHYRQAFPAPAGDLTILETAGRGHYVGTVQSVLHAKIGWYGEGDDRFFIDGEATPSIRGTGTEDYFGDAWGFRPFSGPMLGVPLWEGNLPGDRGSAYRWHLADPVSFKRSLKVTIEHRGSLFTRAGIETASFAERPDWISSVAYWYQTPPTSSPTPLPSVEKRLPPYRVLALDGLTTRATPGIVLVKNRDGLMYLPRKPDAQLEMDFAVEEDGEYQVSAILGRGLLFSRYQPILDGRDWGPVLDQCDIGLDPVWHSFDVVHLSAGKHTLAFEGKGNSPRKRSLAPDYFGLQVAGLILLRLEDLAGTK